MYVPDSWVPIGFELIPSSSEQVLDSAKVFLADINVFPELGSGTRKQSLTLNHIAKDFYLAKFWKCGLVSCLCE
jgi:hypothetical protein